jgi:hypothetical protein
LQMRVFSSSGRSFRMPQGATQRMVLACCNWSRGSGGAQNEWAPRPRVSERANSRLSIGCPDENSAIDPHQTTVILPRLIKQRSLCGTSQGEEGDLLLASKIELLHVFGRGGANDSVGTGRR